MAVVDEFEIGMSGTDLVDTLNDINETVIASATGKQDSTLVTKTTYHTPSTTAVFAGQTIDSGQTPTVTGTGQLTTVSSSSGYIHDPTNTNTYIFVNSGAVINRVEQLFRGTQGVIAIGQGNNIISNDYLHIEFPTSSTAACTIYIDGVTSGGTIQMALGKTISTIPNLNDGTTHLLAVEVLNDFVTAYVDGVQVGIWSDPRTSTVGGSWYYVQITGITANCKIYGFTSYGEQPQSYTLLVGLVQTGGMQSQILHVGQVSDSTYEPTTSIHLWTNNERVRLEGKTYGCFTIEALGAGQVSQLECVDASGSTLILGGLGNGSARLVWQGTQYINIANSGRLSFTYPLSGSTVANATDAASVIARFNELLAIQRAVGIITT